MISIEGSRFKDEAGRTLLLRGINLGGSSKTPFSRDDDVLDKSALYSEGLLYSERFFEHRDVSFVGRPFPIEEADEHFARLKEWLNMHVHRPGQRYRPRELCRRRLSLRWRYRRSRQNHQ